VVQVGSNVGEVEKVGIRSTTVRTRDNVELLIPNSHLLTQVVTNLTHTDELVRLHIPVGVSYNANPRQVEAVLLDAVPQNPAILEDPAPSVLFRNFGESSLDFDLLVWTGKAIQSPTLTSRFPVRESFETRSFPLFWSPTHRPNDMPVLPKWVERISRSA
jgi:small-conductance mechanosensitive channel